MTDTKELQAQTQQPLPALVRDAWSALQRAETAAEVLEAKELAGLAYDTAKRAARLAKAKAAHDELVAAAYRAQADALAIEVAAKRRLADEYDAAQEDKRAARPGRPKNISDENILPTADQIGLSTQQIHDARKVRDMEQESPGIVARTAHELADAGESPTRAAVKRAIAAGGEAAENPPGDGRAAAEVIDMPPPPRPSGPRIGVPEGMTVEDLVRRGVAAESDGGRKSAAAGIGVDVETYRRARLIIATADLPYLTADDRRAADAAVALMNRTRQVHAAYSGLEPLLTRLYGPVAARPRLPPSKLLERRHAEFERRLMLLTVRCADADSIELPYLSAAQRRDAAARIRGAVEELRALLGKIEDA